MELAENFIQSCSSQAPSACIIPGSQSSGTWVVHSEQWVTWARLQGCCASAAPCVQISGPPECSKSHHVILCHRYMDVNPFICTFGIPFTIEWHTCFVEFLVLVKTCLSSFIFLAQALPWLPCATHVIPKKAGCYS